MTAGRQTKGDNKSSPSVSKNSLLKANLQNTCLLIQRSGESLKFFQLFAICWKKPYPTLGKYRIDIKNIVMEIPWACISRVVGGVRHRAESHRNEVQIQYEPESSCYEQGELEIRLLDMAVVSTCWSHSLYISLLDKTIN